MHMSMKRLLVVAAVALCRPALAQTNLDISLVHQSGAEARTRDQLVRFVEEHRK
jgi:hypothetical protein